MAEGPLYQSLLSHFESTLSDLVAKAMAEGRTLDIQRLPYQIVELAARLMASDGCALFLSEGADDLLRLVCATGVLAGCEGQTLKADEDLPGRVYVSGKPLAVKSYPRLRGRSAIFAGLPLKAMLGVPLKQGERIDGVLIFASNSRPFTSDDMALARLFATHIAVSVQTARLHNSEQDLRMRASTLLKAAQTISSTLSLKEVLHLLLQQCRETLPCVTGSIVVYEGDEPATIALIGYDQEAAPIVLEGIKRGTRRAYSTSQVISRKAPLIIPDVREIPEWEVFPTGGHIRSWMGVPLIVRGECIGTLTLDSDQVGVYTPEHVEIAQVLASQAAIAIENARLYEAERAARARADALLEISRTITSTLSLEEVFERILQQVRVLIPYVTASISVIEEGRQTRIALAGYGDRAQEVIKNINRQVSIGRSPHLSRIARTLQPLLIPDISLDPEWVSFPTGQHIRCWVGVPLLVQGKMIGLLTLDSDQPGFYTHEHVEMAQALAPQAAIAIQNAQLYEAERKARTQTGALLEIGRALSSTLHQHDILQRILEQCRAVLPYETASIVVFEDETPTAVVQMGFSDEDEALNLDILKNSTVLAQVARERKPLIIEDVLQHPGWIVVPGRADIHAWMGVPLLARDELIGVLMLDGREPGTYTQEHLEIAQALAVQAGIAIQNSRLYERTRQALTRTQAFHRISQKLVTVQGPEDILQALIEPMEEVGASLADLWYVDVDAAGCPVSVRLVASARTGGKVLSLPLEARFSFADFPIGKLLVDNPRTIQLIADTSQPDERLDELSRQVLRAHNIGALMAVPLIQAGRWVGLITLKWAEPHVSNPQELQFFSAVASQLAAVLDSRRLFEQTQRTLKQTEQLYEGSSRILQAHNLGEVTQALVASTPLQHFDRVALMLFDPLAEEGQPDKVRFAARWIRPGLAHLMPLGSCFPIEEYPAVKLLREREPVVIHDVATDPRLDDAIRRIALEVIGTRGVLILPLWVGKRSIGGFVAQSDTVLTVDEDELRQITGLIAQAAMVIENIRLLEQAQSALAQTQRLYQASQALITANEPDEMLKAIAGPALESGVAAITLLYIEHDADGRPKEARVAARLQTLDLPMPPIGTRYPISEKPMRIAELGQPHAVAQINSPEEIEGLVSDQFALWARQLPIRAAFSVPLKVGERWVGAVSMFWLKPYALSPDEELFYRAMAPQLAATIDNRRLFEQTRRAEARFRDIALSSSDWVWEIGLDWRLAYGSERIQEVLGYTIDELLGHTPLYILPRSEAQRLKPLLRELVTARKPLQIEFWARHKAGHLVLLSLSGMPVINQQGELTGYRGVLKDITRQREAEQREKLAYELGQRLITVLSLEELFRAVTEQIQQVLGYYHVHIRLFDSATQVLNGQGDPKVHDRISLHAEPSLVARAARERRPVVSNDVSLEPGYLPSPYLPATRAEAAIPLLRGDRLLGVLDVQAAEVGHFSESEVRLLEDLAAQIAVAIENARLYQALERQAEHLEELVTERSAAIVRERERLKAIVENAGEGIIFSRVDGTIQYVNPAWERLTGYPASRATGRAFCKLLRVTDERDVEAMRTMEEAVSRGEVWSGSVRVRRPDGSEYDLSMTMAPIIEAGGEVSNVVGVMHDITAQKELDRMRSQFVANVSHELRTPIANLKLYQTLLHSGRPEKRELYLTTMAGQISRLERLVEDLLDLSRLDRGMLSMNPSRFDVNVLVEEVLRVHLLQAEERSLEIKADLTPDLPPVYADRERLMQVLTNLLTNAINYTDAGSRIGINTRLIEEEGKPRLAISVWDTGIGITPDDLPFIFNRFFRAETAKVTGVPGTGLGLAIVKEIVEQHGGQIRVESTPGKGSTFTVLLPPAPIKEEAETTSQETDSQ
jgi:PAS domain S-box-containing protein